MTYAINTTLTMFEHPSRLGTIKPRTITATVIKSRPNCFGGVSYMLKFELPVHLGGKPVTAFRSLADYELQQREATVVKKTRKQPKPRTVARTGNVSQLKKAG